MSYDVFISYRRGGGKEIARPLKEALCNKGYKVFIDFDELTDGRFDERILRAIDEAPVFIVILSEHALDRCVNEDDWVRKEIEYALSKDKHIIPINPDKQFRSFPEGLSDSLKSGLGQHQISVLDTEQLFVESINKIDKNRIQPIIKRKKQNHRIKLCLALLGVILFFVCFSFFASIHDENQKKCFEEAVAYANGDGVSVDKDKALDLFTRLANKGDLDALFNVGVLYSERGDFVKAAESYEKASQKGHAPSCRTLATYYAEGKGVPKDEKKAYELTTMAAEAGDITAVANLGVYCYRGIGTERDVEAAFNHLIYAADHGNVRSMIRVSDMLFDGEGTLKNPEEAVRWLERAVAAGSSEALSMLGARYLHGEGVEKDINRGIDYLIDSGESGFEDSYLVLIEAFLNGSIAWKDPLFSLIFLNEFSKDSEVYTYYSDMIRNAKGDSHLYLLNHPTFENSDVLVRGVKCDAKETTVFFSIHNEQSESIWYSIDHEVVLKTEGQAFHFIRSRNIPFSPERAYIDAGKTTFFYIVFPALPRGVYTFDIVEPGDEGWKFLDITLSKEWT